MPVTGLFTRLELKKAATKKETKKEVSAEYLNNLGLNGLRNYNVNAYTPNMQPVGNKEPLVYVLGEWPTDTDDREGQPFSDANGDYLYNSIPSGDKDYSRFDNVVRTVPPPDKIPAFTEVECYKNTIIASIEEAKPTAILALGRLPAQFALGYSLPQNEILRGRKFPVKIGNHKCWLYTTYDISFIRKIEPQQKVGKAEVPGREVAKFFKYDIKRCYDEVESLTTPEVIGEVNSYLDTTKLYNGGDHQVVIDLIDSVDDGKQVTSNDIETNGLRPYKKGSKILTIAVSGKDVTFAFSVDHIQSKWTSKQKELILARYKQYLESQTPKVCHNVFMEMEWYAWKFGVQILRKGVWHCTQAQAYILDCRPGGKSLDFLCLQHFGVHLKDQSNVDRAALDSEPVINVLKYNYFDPLFTRMLYFKQKALLKEQGLLDVYFEQVRRVPSVVVAGYKGFRVDQAEVKKHQSLIREKESECRKAVMTAPEVMQYRSKYGEFNPGSPQQCTKLFRDMLGRKEGQRKKKYSTDEKALTRMKMPFADSILALRKICKLKETYIDTLDLATKGCLVYSDNRVHATFTTMGTDTRRLSCNDPNMQNYPRRKNAEIRSMFSPGPGNVIIKADYGALEYRCIGILSKDKVIYDSLYNGYDVHLDWSKRIRNVYPDTYEKRYGKEKGGEKKWRDDTKQYLVFAGFYGSKPEPMAEKLEIPMKIFQGIYDEFWEMFYGVKNWQVEEKKFYDKYGYIQTPTGYRRYGPLSDNMVFNSPPQSLGSDIVMDAMNRLNEMALEVNDLNLSPNLTIHDDLTFELPENRVDHYLPIIVKEMVKKSFDFIEIPLLVEVSGGKNWYEAKKDIGKFETNKLPAEWYN